MKRSLILAALIAAVVFHVQAIEMVGSRSCGTWIANSTRTAVSQAADQAWLVGFLSGLALGMGKDFLSGSDNDSMYLWIDNYCRSNPLKRIDDAGLALAQEIIDQKRR